MAHHVHRPAPMGERVLINESWYQSQIRCGHKLQLLRDSRKSRAIALIGLPSRCSRRILVIVSTTNIPVPAVRNRNGGASHNEMKGVNFRRRSPR